MSASPAPTPTGPNGARSTTSRQPAPVLKKKQPAKTNIFNTKRPVRKLPPAQRPPGSTLKAPQQTTQQNSTAATSDSPQDYQEFPIYIQNFAATEEGRRYHALKLQSRAGDDGKPVIVSPFDESQFPRPLRLHRRFGRDKIEVAELSDAQSGADDKEREQYNARRAERQAEREENQKLIAPTGGEAHKPNKKKPSKKVEEGRDESDPIRQRRQKLRYEESRPWHLEDFEGKNVWAGSYEEALAERSIMLEVKDGFFRVIPIEKWYKFIQTNKAQAMSAEDIEKYLTKKAAIPRWAMGTQKANDEARKQEVLRAYKERQAALAADEDDVKQNFDGEFDADRDLLDMDFGEEFQDDDEGVIIQGEDGDDGTDITKRLWLEMREAGLGGTGVKNEDLDPEEVQRKEAIEEAAKKKKEKKLRKRLMKREHKNEYAIDSDSGDMYADSSDSSDSDEEHEKETQQKKEEEAKATGQANGDKSGASSRGTNTPSGRPEKRPNPDASDASGNESTRKRAKLNGAAVSKSGARSLSPDAARPKVARSAAGSGSGSDTDTSRPGRPKLKLKNSPPGSPSANTPAGSRAGSPSASGSRAQSPKPNGAARKFPTLEEVRRAIPAQGILIPDLVGLFKAQVGSRGADFIALVKAAGVNDKSSGGKTSRILPKPA